MLIEQMRSRVRLLLCLATAASFAGAADALAASGDLDPTFSEDGLARSATPDANESLVAVEPLPDGGALVAGTRSLGALLEERYRAGIVVRIRDDGTADPSYGDDGVATIEANPGMELTDAEVMLDGSVVVVGVAAFGTSFGPFTGVVARSAPDGTLDRSFAGDGILAIDDAPGFTAVEVDDAGRILAAGAGGSASPDAVTVMRLEADGQPDPSYSDDGSTSATVGSITPAFMPVVPQVDLTLGADGSAIVGVGNRREAVIVRVGPNGALDGSFGNGGQARLPVGDNAPGFGVKTALRPDGRIVLVTDEVTGPYAPLVVNYAYQLEPNGSVDPDFTTRLGNLDGADIALTPSGHAIVEGMHRTSGEDSGDFGAEVLDPGGGLSAGFGQGGAVQIRFDLEIDEASAVALDEQNRILLAGRAGYRFPSGGDPALARLETVDGPPDRDADKIFDRRDECMSRFGPKADLGCPTNNRGVDLSKGSGSSLRGTIRSEDVYCASSGSIRLLRKRHGADLRLGRVHRLALADEPRHFGHRFKLRGKAPRSLDDVYARVGRTRSDDEGICRAERSGVAG